MKRKHVVVSTIQSVPRSLEGRIALRFFDTEDQTEWEISMAQHEAILIGYTMGKLVGELPSAHLPAALGGIREKYRDLLDALDNLS